MKKTKKLTVVAYQESTGRQYAETLRQLFGSSVEVTYESIYSRQLKNLDADIILASTYSVCELLKQHVPDFDNITIANITLKKDSVDQLRAIAPGTRALLVNSSLQDAIDTISLIHRCGIKQIDFTPAYPPISDELTFDLAVTPGERGLVPAGIKTVIDLSDRVLSMKTFIEIAVRLNSIELLHRPAFQKYFDSIVSTDTSAGELLYQINYLEQQLKLVMQIFDSGILSLDENGVIVCVNEPAVKLIGLLPSQMISRHLLTIIPGLARSRSLSEVKEQVVKLNSHVLIISIHTISYTENQHGYIVLLKKFTDVEREQLKIRRQVMAKGHTAKYTFDDIVGESQVMQRTKELAKRMARSNSSVLIYGQTGTGKELFAQSIHNASPRKHYPFIAINCSAIPENLLESELFGYAEGAFTGARKGGKSGYFEQAHGGTLFLDEISEMNIHLQTRLLRVLQEKEVTRIGGDSVINVDVRVIAASNRKLKPLVNQSAFRADLYYRLNVLRIQLPSLDERREDIPLLIDEMKKELGADFTLLPDARKLLDTVHFEGNVRELRNLVERLNYSDQSCIDADELMRSLDQETGEDNRLYTGDRLSAHFSNPDPLFNQFLDRFSSDKDGETKHILPVLSLLSKTFKSRLRLGRKTVMLELEQNGIYLSEQEIRTIVQTLAYYRLVRTTRGRGGTCITDLGMKALEQLSVQMGGPPK